jgi:hypothetical protein
MKTVTCVTGCVTKGNKWILDFGMRPGDQVDAILGGFCGGDCVCIWG